MSWAKTQLSWSVVAAEIHIGSSIFGRTDLRKGVSGAIFYIESDFEVHFAIALKKKDKSSKT